MTKIVAVERCGYSPRTQFLEAFSVVLAEVDVEGIRSRVTEDGRWLSRIKSGSLETYFTPQFEERYRVFR